MSTQPAQSMPRSWHKAWKNVTVSFKNYLMSEWMNPWKTIPLGPEHLTAKPYITLSSWITYRLSQYSKSFSHGVQTISCHEMHRGNAQINLSSSSALIFKRRESYTSLWDAVLTPNKQKIKVTLSKWLAVGNEVIRFQRDCLLPPWTPGSWRQACREAITWLRRQHSVRWELILSQRWASEGQSMAKRRALPAVSILRVHLLFLESQGKWHRQECVLGFKYILVILLSKCWGQIGSSPKCLGNWCPSCISVRH